MTEAETMAAPKEMTLRQYLRVHPDYRTVQREPRRCMILERGKQGSELRIVRIIEDISATLEAETNEGYLVVEARTSSLGEQAPYFSLTATLYKSKRGARMQSDSSCIAGGCMHEDILAAVPNLAPIEALHLADAITGEPMHAAANGWYFYSGKAREQELRHSAWYPSEFAKSDRERAAQALRIAVDELPRDMDEQAFGRFVETLRERWAREAAHGLELLEALASAPTGKPSPNGTLTDPDERGF